MKRVISLMLALVIVISAAVPAYATGDGNFDGGGGSMGDGTKTNYWNPGMDGVRVSIVDVGSHSVVRTPIDLTNKVPIANIAHFGKVSKLSYNAGRGLSVSVSGWPRYWERSTMGIPDWYKCIARVCRIMCGWICSGTS